MQLQNNYKLVLYRLFVQQVSSLLHIQILQNKNVESLYDRTNIIRKVLNTRGARLPSK